MDVYVKTPASQAQPVTIIPSFLFFFHFCKENLFIHKPEQEILGYSPEKQHSKVQLQKAHFQKS